MSTALIAEGEGVEDSAAIGAFMPNRQQRRGARRDTRKLRKDPHRRRKYLSHVRSDHTVIRSVVATLEALLEHSSDTADPVFPSQRRLAALVGCDVRTIQRHIQELRQAGYLLVYVYAPKETPQDAGIDARPTATTSCSPKTLATDIAYDETAGHT